MRRLILLALLLANPVLAQPAQQHGPFDTQGGVQGALPDGTAARPFNTVPAPGAASPTPSTTPTSVQRPDGGQLATSALQPPLTTPGAAAGSGTTVTTVPGAGTVQPVSATSLPLPTGAATAAGQAAGGPVTAVPQAARSTAWLDASLTATTTASTPTGNTAAVTSRVGIHVWNDGANLVCMAYGGTPAATSASACAKGSVPIPAGSAYLEDQPGNVDPSALAFVTFVGSSDLTIKVR